MPIPIMEACKKRKRTPKHFSLHAFGEPSSPALPKCPFRDKVRIFLRECAEVEDYNVQGMPVWCTLLVHEKLNLIVPLYTIEEDVTSSPRPYCDYCRCTGWSNHYVSKRRYHFVIPGDSSWNKPLDESVFDEPLHLLHGLIHCNGFGHLLTINGIEGGSRFLFGREIMDLWDRICNTLNSRKITVTDCSKKRSMELRLLHGVAYRHPWFGRWGYGFCHGSFGVKEHNYRSTIDLLCSLELDKIIDDFSKTDQALEMKRIIRFYRDMSETQLITLNDLLKFMLTAKHRTQIKTPIPGLSGTGTVLPSSVPSSKPRAAKKPTTTTTTKYRRFTSVVATMDSRWPQRRLEFAADVIVGALKEKKESSFGGNGGGMTRQEVRDAARLHIGDTGLLDYVLKSLNNVLVGDQVVRRVINPATRILEYSITQVKSSPESSSSSSSSPPPRPSEQEKVAVTPSPAIVVPGIDVYGDVSFVYKHVLMEYPDSELVELAVQIVLDTKQFVKEWPFSDEEDQLLAFAARFMSSAGEAELDCANTMVGEIVYVPLHATVGDLKMAVQSALRDTYCALARLVVEEIEGLEDVDDDEVLFGRVESGAEIRVRGGAFPPFEAVGRQGGSDAWKVTCECGARDDDGERMVACDICEVWQHTRCCGIDDAEAVPPLFVCSSCCISLAPPQRREISDDLLLFDHSFDYGLSIGY